MIETHSKAVQEAVNLGPMIGPSAAFSAAFSTVKQAVATRMEEVKSDDEGDACAEGQDREGEDDVARDEDDQDTAQNYLHDVFEDVAAPDTVFDPEVKMFEKVINAMISDVTNATMQAMRRDLVYYAREAVWSSDEPCLDKSLLVMSDGLERSVALIYSLLTSARKHLDDELFVQLMDQQLDELDEYLFTHVIGQHRIFSASGAMQLHHDLRMLNTKMQALRAANDPAACRTAWEAALLLSMKREKATELMRALDGPDAESDQIQTMLEACMIYALSPTQCLAILQRQLS